MCLFVFVLFIYLIKRGYSNPSEHSNIYGLKTNRSSILQIRNKYKLGSMESYDHLLEKTRVPQPSLQKFAVISIFSKLRSAPKYLDSESDPGRDAISQCLNSSSPAVVDQSVRELCRLVTDSVAGISRSVLELQSVLEGTNPEFVTIFVKGLGFLVRYGFEKNASWRSNATELHPFVKVRITEVKMEFCCW